MIKYLSRYRPKYLRTLVYMLQASEYNLRDYFQWYARTKDFSAVEQRKKLVFTPKAKLLLVALWIVSIKVFLLVLGARAIADWPLWPWLGLVGITLLAMPYLLAYGIAVPLWIGQVLIQRPRERAIISKARGQLAAHQAIKIAIVGSYGKTTFKEVLATLLGQGKKVAATPGNMNTPLGISRFADGLAGDEQVLIFEMGEYYPGDIRDLCHLVQPSFGVITGVNEAHLSKFKTLERTAATIFELSDYLSARQVPSKSLYVNGESHLAAAYIENKQLKAPAYSRYGVDDWEVSNCSTSLEGTQFECKQGLAMIKASSRLLGMHQVGPLVAAIDIAHKLGLTTDQIQAGVAETRPFAHRLEPKENEGVITIDDSYNGNPDGVRTAIDFLAHLSDHRRIFITPGLVEMGAMSREVHQAIGRQLAKAVEVVVLVQNSVTPYIEDGLNGGGFNGQLLKYPDGLAALKALPSLTKSGDVVLIQNDWPDNYA